jgi:hypothetical protein
MDTIFRLCFHFLHALADITGLSYEAVNVIIFVFIGPAVFLTLAYRVPAGEAPRRPAGREGPERRPPRLDRALVRRGRAADRRAGDVAWPESRGLQL